MQTLLILGEIGESDFAYCNGIDASSYRSLVCLLRSCIVLKRQKIPARFHDFFCIRQQLHVSSDHIALKFGLHWSTRSSPNFALKCPTPVDFIEALSETFDGKLRPGG